MHAAASFNLMRTPLLAFTDKDTPMKSLATSAFAALIAVSALSVPMAASAQSRHNNDGRHASAQRHQPAAPAWQSINARQSNLERRINVGVRNGALSRREATALRAQFRQIANLESRYRRGGLSNWERRDLDQRFDRLSAQIRQERRDRDNRADRGGRDGRRG